MPLYKRTSDFIPALRWSATAGVWTVWDDVDRQMVAIRGWTAVAELPRADLLPSGTGGGASPAQPSSSNGGMLGGNTQEVLNAILGSAKPVSGAWGSGELLHTSLLNVLITGGEMYVGAVEPSVLYSAVGHATAG